MQYLLNVNNRCSILYHPSTGGSSFKLLAHRLSECGAMPAAILTGIYSTLQDAVGMRGATITACIALAQKR